MSFLAEDIYTAAGWESMYQNGYKHGSPSKFSAKSAIYTAAGCQHIIAIYTAAVPEQIQTIYTAVVCPQKIAIYTAAIQEPNRLYTLLPDVYKKIVIYTAAIRQPNRLYTLLPGLYTKKRYLHGSRSRANSIIYRARQRIHTRLPGGIPCIKMVINTAALQNSQPNRLYTRLSGVSI